ncbi:MAG: hypothetical protein ACLT1K_08370, partial [[Clostridium] leptum]
RRGIQICASAAFFSDKDISTMMNSFSGFSFFRCHALCFLGTKPAFFLFSTMSKYVFFSSVSSFILLSRVFRFLLPSSSISQTRSDSDLFCISVPAHSVFPDRNGSPASAGCVTIPAQMPQVP